MAHVSGEGAAEEVEIVVGLGGGRGVFQVVEWGSEGGAHVSGVEGVRTL